MLSSVLEAIGHTPLLRPARLGKGLPGTVLLKLENRNPGGSIKDRVALHLLRVALAEGTVQPGGTILEATSGNMGIGLALAARALGLRAVLTMPESMSMERRKLMAAFGAEVVLTKAELGMKGAVDKASELAKERDGFLVGQFSNPRTPEAHYIGTGPEILADTGGEVHALVAGVGSGSTLMGTGRFLKERLPQVHLVAVEPAESAVLSGKAPGPHGIQGIGAGFVPEVVDRRFIDEIVCIPTASAIATARTLLAEEGISAGMSTGANVCAALQLAARPDFAGKTIVTFVCDTGERYLSTELFA